MNHEHGGVQMLPNRTAPNPSVRAADQHFRAAEEALRQGDYERAAAEFTYSIQLAPARAEAFAKRGDIGRILGRVDSAVSDYSAALQIHPRNESVLLSRGQLHAMSGRHLPAVADLSEALEINPANATAYLNRGQALMRLGEMIPALADFTRSIDLAPGNALAFVERGTALLANGDPAVAVSDFRRAVQLNPFLWLALARRADAYLALGQPELAAADLTEALRLDSQNAELLAARGSVYLQLGKRDSALDDFNEAVALTPQAPNARLQRARAYRALGRLDEAEVDLTEALRLKPGDSALHYARAEVRLESKKLDPAFSDFIEVSRRSPQNGMAYHGQALVYIARDDYQMAVTCLDRCLETSTTCADAFYQRARCRLRMEQLEESHADASQAIAIEPENVAARRLRADVALRLGRIDEAFSDVAQLVNLAPEDPIVYHLRGKLEFRRGRLDAAIQDLSVSLKLNPNFTEALADRAGVFRGLGKHREALFDLTSAVQQDAKYSAEYLVQRGIVHGATGELNRATADFLVALQLDPSNKAAIRGKDLVSQLRDSRGPSLSESAEFDLDRQAEADRVMGGAKRGRSWRSLIEPDEFAPSRPVARRGVRKQLAPAAESEVDLAVTDDTGFEVHGGFDSQSELDLEALDRAPPVRSPRPAPRKKPVAAPTVEEQAEETIDEILKDEESKPQPFSSPEHASSLATPSLASRMSTAPMPTMNPIATTATNTVVKPVPRKKSKKEDAEERTLRMRKYRRYAIIALGSCFLLYWSGALIWELIPQAENPFTVYSAEEFVERYVKDSGAADDKFAEKRVAIRGKIKGSKDKNGKATNKFYFDTNAPQADMKIEIQFSDEDPPRLIEGDEVLINGKPARFKPGMGIVLRDCNIMPAGKSAVARNADAKQLKVLVQNAAQTEFVRGFIRFRSTVHTDHTKPLYNTISRMPSISPSIA